MSLQWLRVPTYKQVIKLLSRTFTALDSAYQLIGSLAYQLIGMPHFPLLSLLVLNKNQDIKRKACGNKKTIYVLVFML
jgi:hypothetical protein